MALAFLAALTQCKKEQETPATQGKTVDITLDINNDGGAKVDVNTGTGAVTYQSGDVVYVASGGKFVGTLTHNGTRFAGTITDPVVGEPLHFYFLGNVTPAETLTAGTTTTCSVVISDQTERLPVIEYAPSDQNYTGGASNFTAMLLNKCALVKFNVATRSSTATCITGFNNKVTVDFSNNTLTPTKEGFGTIKLAAGNGEKWAVLLPQEAMEAGAAGSASSADGVYMGTRGAVPAICDNGYLTSGIDVTVYTVVSPSAAPEGAIWGKFTINENGEQVYFSKGNLQYQPSTQIWRFAEHQYDVAYTGEYQYYYITDWETGEVTSVSLEEYNNYMTNPYEDYYCVADVSALYTASCTDWIDLFGWGTSGYNHGAVCYQPWSTSQTNSDYYAYGNSAYNLGDQTGNADWGHNSISNGGSTPNQWRTLTAAEWNYLLFERNTLSGYRCVGCSVNGVKGIVLLPDNWVATLYPLPYSSELYYGLCAISVTDWTDILEANGAVFLPAAGRRHGNNLQGNRAGYWSSTREGALIFDQITAAYMEGDAPWVGLSVRPVCFASQN